MKKGNAHHVVPHGDGWAVKRSGADRTGVVVDTQLEAIDAGREISRNQGTELVIHGRQGQIRERDSHRDDPYPPKG